VGRTLFWAPAHAGEALKKSFSSLLSVKGIQNEGRREGRVLRGGQRDDITPCPSPCPFPAVVTHESTWSPSMASQEPAGTALSGATRMLKRIPF
jgi:hypothetical protein